MKKVNAFVFIEWRLAYTLIHCLILFVYVYKSKELSSSRSVPFFSYTLLNGIHLESLFHRNLIGILLVHSLFSLIRLFCGIRRRKTLFSNWKIYNTQNNGQTNADIIIRNFMGETTCSVTQMKSLCFWKGMWI